MAMLWPILVIIAVLGVVLPVAVWWLASRQASARPPYSRARRDAFGALMDPVEAWLVDHAELPSLQRLSVRTAVFGGEAVDDESLRPVARRLAAELLSGGLTSQVGGWSWLVLAAVGAVELMAFAALWLVSGHPQARFASLVSLRRVRAQYGAPSSQTAAAPAGTGHAAQRLTGPRWRGR